MLTLKQIKISNFRSIVNLSNALKPNHLNIFVGNNDAGKSNILKALSLFFNDETDPGQSFRFEDDFSYRAQSGKGKAREVKIELIITPPVRFKNAKPIKWTKRWRKDEQLEDKKFLDGTEIPNRSNITVWLDKIIYRYVPAIKGENYFASLMGDLHDVLNTIHSERFKEQGKGFITGIQEITKDISSELKSRLRMENSIQVPSDFKHLFSSLDFGTEDDGNIFFLKRRGDGIKSRHIPIILKYMADQEKKMSVKGSVVPNTIWGFEEPENNLEMKNVFQLSKSFLEYSKEIQILVTTHSPAFYSLDKPENKKVNTYFVKSDRPGNSSVIPTSSMPELSLHNEMGILPLIAPYVEEMNKKVQLLEEAKEELNKLRDNCKCVVLTEDSKHETLGTLLQFCGFNMNELEIESYDGVSNIHIAIAVAKHIKKENPEIIIVIHRDKDYLESTEIGEIQKKVESHGFHLFLTKGTDLESHFICPRHVHKVYPDISIEKAQTLIEEATDRAKKKSIERLIDHWFKNHKPKNNGFGGQVTRLQFLYEKDKPRYRDGKKVLGNLIGLIQKEIGENPKLITKTEHILDPCLTSFAEQIWGHNDSTSA